MDIAKIRKKLQQPEAEKSKPCETDQIAGEEKTAELPRNEESVPSSSLPAEKKTGTGEDIIANKKSKPEISKEPPASAEQPVNKEIHSEGSENIIEILTFKLLSEDFAFRISDLDEILKFQHITIVPKLPDYVLGITSLRGKVIPVIDLKARLSLRGETSEVSNKKKILIMKGPKGRIGAVVDKVTGVVRIAETEIMPPPSHLSEEEVKFISGVTVVEKRFVSILNMQAAITLSIE